jgi:hypothetical protein
VESWRREKQLSLSGKIASIAGYQTRRIAEKIATDNTRNGATKQSEVSFRLANSRMTLRAASGESRIGIGGILLVRNDRDAVLNGVVHQPCRIMNIKFLHDIVPMSIDGTDTDA